MEGRAAQALLGTRGCSRNTAGDRPVRGPLKGVRSRVAGGVREFRAGGVLALGGRSMRASRGRSGEMGVSEVEDGRWEGGRMDLMDESLEGAPG